VPRIAEIAPEDPRFKTMAADALVTRGDTFFAAGDLASARLFYEHAVAAGNAVAALRLGGTFDPGFLARAGIGRVQGDAAIALYWYRQARDLGNSNAEILLKKMEKLAK
jgi:TPR repeat protein